MKLSLKEKLLLLSGVVLAILAIAIFIYLNQIFSALTAFIMFFIIVVGSLVTVGNLVSDQRRR